MILSSLRTLFGSGAVGSLVTKADAHPSVLRPSSTINTPRTVTRFPSETDIQMLAVQVLEMIFISGYKPPLCLSPSDIAAPKTRQALNAEVLRLTGMPLKGQTGVAEDSAIHLAALQVLETTRKAFGLETIDDSPWVRATAKTMRRYAIGAFEAHCRTCAGPIISPNYSDRPMPAPVNDGCPATVIAGVTNTPARTPDMFR